jgi:hypothetical protein
MCVAENRMHSAWAQTADPQARLLMVIPTTHMDIDFVHPPDASMTLYAGYVRRAMTAVHEDPTLRYSVQLASAVAAFKEAQPRLWSSLAPMVADGRIEICANWTNPHYSELAGETIVRQIAWSKWWLHEHLGIWTQVADNGELADVTPQLAQVLARSHVPYFHTYKIVQLPDRRAGYEGTYWLVGLDGSRILVNGDCYNHSAQHPQQRPWDWPEGRAAGQAALRRPATGNVHLLTDGGPGWDDAMPPLQQLHDFVDGWNQDAETAALATTQLGTWHDYFKAVEREIDAGLRLPVRSGHTEHGELLYRWVWNLVRDRALFENRMIQAQTLAVMNHWLNTAAPSDDAAAAEAAWTQILDTCTHNWANTDRQTRQLHAKAADARAAAERMLGEQAAACATLAGPDQWVVINTLPHARRDLVRLGETWRVIDAPPMGYCLVDGASAAPGPAELIAAEGCIENARYRITADARRGLTSVYDKHLRRELLRPVTDDGGVLRLRGSYNEAMGAERADYLLAGQAARDSEPAQRELFAAWLASTDVTARPHAVHTRLAGDAAELVIDAAADALPVRIVVRLGAGIDAVDITMASESRPSPDLDLPDPRLAEMVADGLMFFATMELNIDVDAGGSRASVPFGSLPLPRRMPSVGKLAFSKATTDQQAVTWYGIYNEDWHLPLEKFFTARLVQPHWLTLWDGGAGVTWLQYAPYANMFRDADHPARFHKALWRADSGGGTYHWRLIGHHGDWRDVNAPRHGNNWQAPLLAVRGQAAADAGLPSSRSLLKITPPNLVFSSLQRGYDGHDFVLRMHEAHDQPARLDDAALQHWTRTDLLQQPTTAGSDVHPFEIVTLRGPTAPTSDE